MTTTTEAALRDAANKLAEMPVKGLRVGEKPYVIMHALDRDALVDLLIATSQPSPASSTAGEDVERLARLLCEQDGSDPDDEVIAGQAAGFENYGPRWQAMQRSEGQCGGRDYVEDAKAIIAALSPSSGEPASVAVEAEARLLDIAAERAAQIRSSCFDYCTGDCNCAQAAESAVDEMERLVAALAEPASPAPVGEQEICPDCMGAGGDNNVWTCPRCNGSGGVTEGNAVAQERADTVKWLRMCSEAARQHHAEVCHREDDDILDAIVTRMDTYAFAADQIEAGVHAATPATTERGRG